MTNNRPGGSAKRQPYTWILTNGMAGYEVQALGLTEAMGIDAPVMKRVNPPAPWRWIAPWGPAAADPNVTPPWPELLIAASRQAIPYARMIARRSKGRTFVVVLQNPHVRLSQFDFVWAPLHDRLKGPNVLSTLISPHRLTPERLAAEAERFAPRIAHLPHPRIGVLIGGTNAVYRMTEEVADRIGAQLADLCDKYGASLLVTPSRRSGKEQIEAIRKRLKDKPAMVWDGTGENPYFGFLGSADTVLVTCDSVNMVGEATATGKPVYVIELEGGSAKFRRFLDAVYASGAARPFAGKLESWEYRPLNATKEIADAILRAMTARSQR